MDVIERAQAILSRDACYRLSMTWDDAAGYTTTLDALAPHPPASLSRAELLPLLPAGSRFLQAAGWHSYVGLSFACRGVRWLSLGTEVVLPHPGRGAVPIYSGFIYPLSHPPLEPLKELADLIDPEGTAHPASCTYGTLQGTAESQQAHASLAGTILRAARSCYGAGRPVYFRTLLLSEDQIQRLSTVPGFRNLIRRAAFAVMETDTSLSIKPDREPFLFGTAPALMASFTWRTRMWIRACRAYRLGMGRPSSRPEPLP